MEKNIVIFLMLIATISCNFDRPVDPNTISTGIGGMEVPPPREFTASEIQIAQRICNNLRAKREFFTGFYSIEKFKFSLELKSCSDSTTSYSNIFEAAIDNSNPLNLLYNTTQENSFKDIVTDQTGAMKSFCDSVSGYYGAMNTITAGTTQLAYKISINNGLDHIEISKQIRNDQGGWKLTGIESIDFISQTTQAAAKFFGVEKERIRKVNCDGKNFSSTTQTWLQATTSF